MSYEVQLFSLIHNTEDPIGIWNLPTLTNIPKPFLLRTQKGRKSKMF